MEKLNAAFRSFLQKHFSEDELEKDREPWDDLGPALSRCTDGLTDDDLDVVWKTFPLNKAAGVDDIPKEAALVCDRIRSDAYTITKAMWMVEDVPRQRMVSSSSDSSSLSSSSSDCSTETESLSSVRGLHP